jgi:hypothetical protein
MAKTTPVTIGADVSCTDGACGKVSRVVIDPAARAVTHLVVDRDDQGRLVPLALVEAATGGIRLRCTIAEFENLDPGRPVTNQVATMPASLVRARRAAMALAAVTRRRSYGDRRDGLDDT